MSDTSLSIELHNRQQAWAAIKAQVYPFLARWLQDGKRLVLTQIAEQAAVGGKLFPAEVWHEQFKRQFIGVIELPNGEVIGKSSTELTTGEFSEFCTQVEAYAVTYLGVTFYELEPA